MPKRFPFMEIIILAKSKTRQHEAEGCLNRMPTLLRLIRLLPCIISSGLRLFVKFAPLEALVFVSPRLSSAALFYFTEFTARKS